MVSPDTGANRGTGGYFDLGNYSRPVTTSSETAQTWFDRGLLWCYGFNHEEAVRCFQWAAEADPDCAMAYWGIAFASGPYYNKPWEFFVDEECRQALAFCYDTTQKAVALSGSCSAPEQKIIRALEKRYPSKISDGPDMLCQWVDDFADAMRDVYTAFPDDLDVIALSAEALMNRTPWALWDVHKGVPAQNADTTEVIEILSRGIDIYENGDRSPHAGIIHLWIHVWEMSPTPERALYAADLLRMISPENAHLLHMATHIDVLCGQYYEAVAANNRAIEADMKYLNLRGSQDFFMISVCHDLKLKMYAAMLLGQFHTAMEAINTTLELLPDAVIRAGTPYMQENLEGYAAMKQHVLIRFGRWQDVIEQTAPADTEFYVMATAMDFYAKGIAYSALGNVKKAEHYQRAYEDYIGTISPTRIFCNNLSVDVLAVGTEMLAGELAYRKGHFDAAFHHLRNAVRLDDNLNYSEPWDWMHPPRHALGALLMEQGHTAEAVEVYEADLGFSDVLPRCCQHPENVWSLHGYVEGLRILGREHEAHIHDTRLQLALARTDTVINSSCNCRRVA